MPNKLEFYDLNWGVITQAEPNLGEFYEPSNIIEWHKLLIYEGIYDYDFYEIENLKKIRAFVESKIPSWEAEDINDTNKVYLIEIKLRLFQIAYFLEDYDSILSNEYITKMFLFLKEKGSLNETRLLFESACLYFITKQKMNVLNVEEEQSFKDLLKKGWKEDYTDFIKDRVIKEEIIIYIFESFINECSQKDSLSINKKIIDLMVQILFLDNLYETVELFDERIKKNYLRISTLLQAKCFELEDKVLGSIFKAFCHKLIVNSSAFEEAILEIWKNIKKTNIQKANLLKEVICKLMEGVYYSYFSPDEEHSIRFYGELSKAIKSSDWKKEFLLSVVENNFLYRFFMFLFNQKSYITFFNIYKLSSESQKEMIMEELTFELAYCAQQGKDRDLAKKIYEDLLSESPRNITYLNNLAMVYKELKNYDKALELLKEGYEIDSSDEFIKRNLKDIEKIIALEKEKPKRIKDFYFKKTDKIDKRIMFTIYRVLDTEDNNKEKLMEILKMPKEYFFNKKLDYLIKNELVIEENNSYLLDPNVLKLIEAYVDPKLERQIIKNSTDKLYRPIFFHESEITLYRVLIELFPQHLVFPNMDLKAIIDVDKIKPLLNNEHIEYLFKAHVDFAIVNTTTYFPILTFEKDSDFNSTSRGSTNAKIKNLIFQTAGIPLIRLRYNTAMNYERLKEEIKRVTKDLMLEIHKENPEDALLNEIDLKKLGLFLEMIDLEAIKVYWGELVGDLIKNHTYNYYLDEENMIVKIEVSTEVEAILEMSLENIQKKMYNNFNLLNKLQIEYTSKNNLE